MPLSRLVKRVLIGIGLALCAIIIVIASIIWRVLPPQQDTLVIPGVSAPIGVSFDTDDVPYIRASSPTDAALALGYVHARDRLFQMDLMRRAAAGDLASLFGPAALPNDREMRILGIRASAEADVADLSPPTRALLQAYADGVNAWIERRGRLSAPEFVFLGKPRPWTIVDSLLWGKTMGLWLSGNWQTELQRLALSAKMPRAKIESLWPSAPGMMPAVAEMMPQTTPGAAAAARQALAWLRHFPQPFTQPAQASNEWALSGTHTATGQPMLAGDPHLALNFPGLWYLARIDTPEGTLAGATVPGLPFLVIGRNDHVAWTFTTTGADTQDVFIEHVSPDGLNYQTPDGWAPFKTRIEVIHVSGQPDETLTVRLTRHGPVIRTGPTDHTVLTVEMGNLAPHDTDADGLRLLDAARYVSDVGIAAAKITSPVQNLMTADTAGNIAFYTTGRVPIRRAGDGAWPQDGADGAHDWTGFASGKALPHSVNPASGRLVNANEPTAAPGFPVFISRDAYGDWRAQRIRELLAQSERHTLDSFAAMQIDTTSDFARRLLPVLTILKVPATDVGAPAAALLRNWDGQMAMDRPQPLIFNAWMDRFVDKVLHRNGLTPDDAPVEQDRFLLSLLLETDGAPAQAMLWCGGDCRPMLLDALNDSVADLKHRYGRRMGNWRWGNAHRALFAHPLLSRIPVVGRFGRIWLSVPGDATTVDVTAPGPTATDPNGFTALHGPELRGVYDLSDLDQSLFVIAPGQSGNLLDSHAQDFLLRWRSGLSVQLGPEPNVVSRQIRIMRH
ncbi:penicillin acylase family protein [Acidisoma cladoniae]|jgi:penicillin amidase|uniref:penicillin acylase family protein n=1 Tax=Acidisoma cladoniae TaxID=3040935 RepID=UPI00254EB353|nr:penicillin acylase family protein [Acidisoma sp. PAMC 29798]